MRSQLGRVILGLAALIAADSQASVPIVDTGGFESFNLAPLAGQNGWFSSGTGTATVQSTVVKSGAKAVKVDKSAGSDSRWGDEVTGYPTARFIMVDWDMRVAGTGAGAGNFGPVFGVEAYDAHVAQAFKLLGSMFVDATTGDVMYQDGEGILTESGTQVTFNAWHSFRLLLDFNLKKYTPIVNGAKLGAFDFVDDGTQFTDADISALAAGFDSGSQNRVGTAYFDNFVVRDGLPGDFDFDGDADGNDFLVWQRGQSPSPVSAGDYAEWKANFGVRYLAQAAASAVPEPQSFALAAAALMFLARLKETRRR